MLSYRNSTAQLTASGIDTAVISVGLTEQCGPCLPFHLDTLLAAYFAHAWGEAVNGYVLPTMPFNTSEEHSAFIGTVTLRPATVMTLLEEIVAGLRRQGFCKQVLTVGHGGSWWMGAFIKDMNWRYADIVLINAHEGADPVWAEAVRNAGLPEGEIHGGTLSRALSAFLAPESVLDGEFGQEVDPAMLLLNGYVTWDKITADGSWGRYTDADAALTTAEVGRTLLESFVSNHAPQVAAHLAQACALKNIPTCRKLATQGAPK